MGASGAGRPGRVLRRVAVAALVAGFPVALPVTAPGTESAVAAPSSWDVKRTDEFSGDSLPKGCTSYGGPYEGGKSYWTKDGVRLAGGLLRLRLLKKARAAGYPYTSGGVGCWDLAQQYGRYEVRAKIPRGKGIDSYITLMPIKSGQTEGWTGVELLDPGPGGTAYITNGFGTGTETARFPGTYSDAFHTYGIEWAPNLTRVSDDDAVIFSSTKSFKGKRWLGMIVSNGDALTGVPDATTKLPAEFQIDYVKTATFTGVPPPAPKPSVSREPAGEAGAQASAAPLKVPATTPAAAAAAAAATDDDERSSLAGGVWPWLLGGRMIAGRAVVSLSYPRARRAPTAAGPPSASFTAAARAGAASRTPPSGGSAGRGTRRGSARRSAGRPRWARGARRRGPSSGRRAACACARGRRRGRAGRAPW